jgi:hypothetical protein
VTFAKEEISQDQKICTQAQARILEEQLARADVTPQGAISGA